MIINSSRRHTFCNCPMSYYLTYVRNIIPEAKYIPFLTGGAVHEGLATWYVCWDVEQAVIAMETNYRSELHDEPMVERDELIEKEIDLGKRMLTAYGKKYPTEKWSLERPEQTFKAVLGSSCFRCGTEYPSRYKLTEPNEHLANVLCPNYDCCAPVDFTIGKADLIVSWHGDLWFVEHKTAKQAGATYMQAFSRAHQTVGYVTQASKALGLTVRGVIINVLKKTKVPDFLRDVFVYGDNQKRQWELDTRLVCNAIRQYTAEHQWPQYTAACYRFGRCSFIPICDTFKNYDEIPATDIYPLGYIARTVDYGDAAFIKEERR